MAFTIFKKLARGLSRTRENLSSTLQTVVGGAEIDEDALEDLETSLLAADLGPQLSQEVIEVAVSLKTPRRLVPSRLTATMMMTAMRATRRPYSTAEAPRSLRSLA